MEFSLTFFGHKCLAAMPFGYKNFPRTCLAALTQNWAQDLGAHHCAPLVHKNDAAAQGTSDGDEDCLLGAVWLLWGSGQLQDQWDNMKNQLHAEHTNYLGIFCQVLWSPETPWSARAWYQFQCRTWIDIRPGSEKELEKTKPWLHKNKEKDQVSSSMVHDLQDRQVGLALLLHRSWHWLCPPHKSGHL